MKSLSRSFRAMAIAGLLGIALPVSAQSPAPAASLPLQERIPFDSAVRTGKLPNGLTYFHPPEREARESRGAASRGECRFALRG
ncbi:MAG: hypothetical protein QM736_04595 [Vicinamibacterales bacterium]